MRLFRNHNRNHNHRQDNYSASDTNIGSPQEFAAQAESLIPADVRMISGCHSEQTSADVSNVSIAGKLPSPAGRAGGACTSALLGLLYKKPKTTFQQLLLDLRDSLSRSGFSQIPQLTSSRNLDLHDTPFSFVGPGGGTRRAVLVGINYRGQSGELSGCQNDVLNMKKYLVQEQGYLEHNILVLIDDGRHHYPTRQKVIRALQQLVAQSVPGDSCYFHYSGHGGLLAPNWNTFKSRNKEYDETLYPLDHAQAGQIRDFSLFNHFVKPMAAGVTVTCVMDCCHSGSVLDLPFSYQPTSAGKIRMRQSLDSLSNLAFLHILAGGMLPHGVFGHVTQHIESVTGGNIDQFQGTGLDEMLCDTEGTNFNPDVGSCDNNDIGQFGGDDVVDAANIDGDVPNLSQADVGPGPDLNPDFNGPRVFDRRDGDTAGLRADPGIAPPDIGIDNMGPPVGRYVGVPDDCDAPAVVVEGEDVEAPNGFGGCGGLPFGSDDDGQGGCNPTDGLDGIGGTDGCDGDVDCGCVPELLGALLDQG